MRENIAKNLCKVIALANQKGGVAKSFTTASLAVGLVNSGNRVYLITALYNAPSTYCNYVAQAYRTVNQTDYESEYDVENKREMEYMKSLRESDPEGYKVYIAGKIEKRKAEGKWIV